MIASWNVQAAAGAKVSVMARVVYPDHETKFYTMGIWNPDPNSPDRNSVKHQKDADGNVDTDTLMMTKNARQVQLLVATQPGTDGASPSIKFLGLNFANTQSIGADIAPLAGVTPLEVPQFCQGDYPNGGVICSPTSVSMVLNYWSQKLNRPDLAKPVPDVVAGVFDKTYNGAGNWPFNAAFAGAFPGMRAYVSRFATSSELLPWLQAGVPVVTSVSLPLLEGKPLPANDSGHLVVLVGVSPEGDPIFNDPAHRVVRQIYKRNDFEQAWNNSKHTVYLIYPEMMSPPEDKLGHWFTR
jgi:hypothetical protein